MTHSYTEAVWQTLSYTPHTGLQVTTVRREAAWNSCCGTGSFMSKRRTTSHSAAGQRRSTREWFLVRKGGSSESLRSGPVLKSRKQCESPAKWLRSADSLTLTPHSKTFCGIGCLENWIHIPPIGTSRCTCRSFTYSIIEGVCARVSLFCRPP